MVKWWIFLWLVLVFIPYRSTSAKSTSHLSKKDCSTKLAGKLVQIEYAYKGWENYFLTFRSYNYKDYIAKVNWINLDESKKPENGFVWMVHPCGKTVDNNSFVCFETLYPNWRKYFLKRKWISTFFFKYFILDYISEDSLTQTEEIYHFGIFCQDCGEKSNTATGCELYFPSLDCKAYVQYKFLEGNWLWCAADKPDDWYQFNIRFDGHAN